MAVVELSAPVTNGDDIEFRASRRRLIQVSDDVIYCFFVGNETALSWVKSEDAGATWSDVVALGDAGNVRVEIYYHRWTSVAFPNVVSIVQMQDTGTRGLRYSLFDLDTGFLIIDRQLVFPFTLAGTAPAGVVVARSGRIYVTGGAQFGDTATWYSDDLGVTWTEVTALLTGSTYSAMDWWPDFSSPDPNDVIAIRWHGGDEELLVSQYDASADTVTDTTFATGMDFDDHGQMATSLTGAGHIRVIAFDANAPASTNLKAWDVFGTTVVAKTNVLTGVTYAACTALSIDAQDRTWAWYARDDDAAALTSMEVYYKRSTDGMVTWGSETAYSTVSREMRFIYADPILRTDSALAAWAESTGGSSLETNAPGPVVTPDQYRLMLSDGADPDIPILNITPLNVGKSGTMLTRFERGRERAVIGEPPRAGALTTRVKNDSTALGYTGAPSAAWTLDEPAPGLSVRLNKSLDSGVTWHHMAQGNVDTIQHHFGADGFRSLIDIRANGPFAKLAGKKVTTQLYQNITTGTAIDIILDEAGFPTHLRDIATGVVTLEWWWLSDTDAMSAIVQLVNTEGLTADLFEAGDGKITFRDRNARYTDARSATAQSTFTSEGSEPRFTGFDYTPGFREIVNEAKATRYRLTVDPAPASTTVWEDGDGISYIVPPNGTLVVEATTTLPVSSAITPVSGTDYTVGLGSAVATLNRVSGSRFTITYTNSDGLGATLANLQLRANTQYIQHGPIEEVSGGIASVRVDVDDSVAAYGLRPWQGSMWSYIGHADMRDNLDVITTVKKDPRAWVRIGLNAEGGTARNTATAQRELGDRIRIINSNPGVEFNEFAWIERIEHEVQAPEREITYYECTPITGALGTNPYDDITNGAGVDTSDEGGSATGTGSTGSSGSSSPSPIALYGFAAGNQLTTFNGVQRITGGDATNIANLIAAGADNAKILVDNGVSITLTSQLVLASFAKLYVPHGGTASISGGSLAGAAIYLNGATDVLIGGLNITSAPGDYTSNQNPASAIEITGASDRIQIVGTTITSPTFGGAVTDAPEGVNIWNNDGTAAAGPGSVTFYRVYWPVAGAGNSTAKSKGVIAGGSTTATRNALTFYECVFSAWQRLPFVQDGAIADIVNCVYPNIDRIDAIEVADGGEARARGSVFRNTTDGSHEWETRNLGGGYIAEGPEANDYQNSATFTEVTPAQVFTVPYSLTVNTAAYVEANVESNVGAGSVIIPE